MKIQLASEPHLDAVDAQTTLLCGQTRAVDVGVTHWPPTKVAIQIHLVSVDGLAAGLVHARLCKMTGALAAMFNQETLARFPMQADTIQRCLQAEMDGGKASRPVEVVAEERHRVPGFEISGPGDWERGVPVTLYSLRVLRQAREEIER